MPQTVHLVNSLHSSNGGSEWHTLSLFEILAEFTEVNLWTEYKPDPLLTGRYPIRGIEPQRGVFPKGGNLVFIGVYFGVGGWVRKAKPRRTIVFFNTPDLDRLPRFIDGLKSAGIEQIEVVYQAEHHRDLFPQWPGPVHPSPIDLSVFSPAPQAHDGYVVGRYSRDNDDKHHADNPELYRRLADAGCLVRIMGGTSQKAMIADDRIDLMEAGTVPPVEFLGELDCFLYRIRADWYEAFGRVVAESMACGVPVVGENRGGYTHLIESGHNGFLFDSNDEAIRQVLLLRENPDLRAEMGHRARETVEALYSPSNQAELAEFYYR
ncbi:MAG: glycosyltransferase family 4 protein [Chlorobia bacterium]|nr:glycosyltransferase family 4 protein [Fimbriimonadaceae bacterium]